jgi:uncharacterized oligopeptide transporter (OPT) family protein
MGLFQKAPRTEAEIALARPLEIGPDQVQELSEEEWYARVYRGGAVPQLTVRSVLTGSIFGFILAFTNLYVGLTAGWALGVVITAALVCFAMWQFFLAAGLARSPMGALEMNCMASTASSAGYATGGTMVSAIAAMMMLSATPENPQGEHIPLHVMMMWTASLGFLGTVMAIPMKRNMVNHERLRFPTGTAAAVTIQSLFTEGQQAIKKARALLWTAAGSAVLPFLFELRIPAASWVGRQLALGRESLLPTQIKFLDWLPAPAPMPKTGASTKPSDWTWFLDLSAPYMAAAGMLVGLRTTISMLLGGLVIYYGLAPTAVAWEWTNPAGEAITAITAPSKVYREAGLWLGVSVLVASSLLAFGLQWKTIARAFRGIGGSGSESSEDALEQRVRDTEVPMTWFLWGTVIFGGVAVFLADRYFEVPLLLGILAVAMTFLLSLVACRVTGETDITPMGPLGKIMQLTFGALIPRNATANLMAAGITANASGNAADLLTDLKSGYLLGANPRRQFVAQFLGVISGTVATALGFRLLVPDATVLNGTVNAAGEVVKPEFDAPAAATWKAVADVFQHGFDSLHPMHVQLIWWGLGIGVMLVLIETAMPKQRSRLPSATGFGFGMIFGFQYAILMLLGAIAAWAWSRSSKRSADDYLVPVAGGVIAGYTLLAVVVALLNTVLLKDL